MKKKVLGSLLDSGAVENLTLVIAEAEHELLTAARRLEDAQGLDVLTGDPAPVDARQAALKNLLKALVGDSFGETWMEEVGSELLDEPDRAAQYLGTDGDEWDAQVARWAEFYRDAGATGDDRALAEHHVRETFGVDLDTFERRVVEFDKGAEAERLFAGNFRAVVAVIDAAAEQARDGGADE